MTKTAATGDLHCDQTRCQKSSNRVSRYSQAFRVYIEGVPAPTPTRGDVVVLGNLPAHKVAGIRQIIAFPRARIFYLPPYSPDMNPIEMAFARPKALLRQVPARTVDALVERIGCTIDCFLPAECENVFHAAGYQRSM